MGEDQKDDLKATPDDPAQSKRFIDMAHEVGATDDEVSFEAKVKAIARYKPKAPNKGGDESNPPVTERGKEPAEDF